MDRKVLIGGGVLLALLVLAIFLAVGNGGGGPDQVNAKLTILTGTQPGKQLKSTLNCQGNKAEGDGMYRFPAKAKQGCLQVKKLKSALTEKQIYCPRSMQDGPVMLSLNGEINGKPVKLEQRNQMSCQGRMAQIAKVTPFIQTAQQAAPQPSFAVVVTPPEAPPLTEADQAKAEEEIKRLGWRAYQQKMAAQLKKLGNSGKKLKPCPRPLPEVYVTCFVNIVMLPNEDQQQAFKRAYKENPDWFYNSSIPQASSPVGRIIRQKQTDKLER